MPWSSRSVVLESKFQRFFDTLDKFHSKISNERMMQVFYFIHAMAALFRLIFQTSAHPRTGVLVNTMMKAAEDLWHFAILFFTLNFGFIGVGMACFGGERVSPQYLKCLLIAHSQRIFELIG